MPKTATRSFDRLMGWLLLAIVAATPFAIVTNLGRPTPGQAFFFQAATLGALALVGVGWMTGRRALPQRPTFGVWLVLLNGAAVLLSLGASSQWLFSLKQALLPICGFIFFGLLVAQPRRRRLLGRILKVLVIVGAVEGGIGLLQHLGVDPVNFRSHEKNMVMGTLGHPNFLASLLGPVLFIVLGLALTRPGVAWKAAGGALAFLILLCVTLAQTRGMWLGLVLGLLAMALLGARYSVRRGLGLRWMAGLAVGALVIAAGLGIVVFRVLPNYNRGVDMERRVTSSYEVKSRFFYWRAAVDMAMAKKLFGQGYGMFDPQFWSYNLELQKSPLGQYYYDVLPTVTGTTPGHVHNEYLEVLAEEGLAGLLALAGLLGFFLCFGYWAIMAQPDAALGLRGAALYGACVTCLVDAVFGFPWRLPVSLLVFVVLLALLYDLIYPQEAAGLPPGAEPAAAGDK